MFIFLFILLYRSSSIFAVYNRWGAISKSFVACPLIISFQVFLSNEIFYSKWGLHAAFQVYQISYKQLDTSQTPQFQV